MYLYKFTHVSLLKKLCPIKTKKVTKKGNHPNLLGNKNHIQKTKNHKRKQKRKKKIKRQRPNQEKKGKRQHIDQRKKRSMDWTSPCELAHGHFHHLLIKFLSILERKHFGRPEEKTSGPRGVNV